MKDVPKLPCSVHPSRRRLRGRGQSRGFVYVEYLIVTGFVFIAIMVAFYKMGPRIVSHFRDNVKLVVEKAP